MTLSKWCSTLVQKLNQLLPNEKYFFWVYSGELPAVNVGGSPTVTQGSGFRTESYLRSLDVSI